jgi:hypothetical protein
MAVLGIWTHRTYGWSLPPPRQCGDAACYLAILFFLCAILSWPLARLYLACLYSPLFAVVVLNCLFYDGLRLMARQFLRGRWPWLEAGLALAGELYLFTSLWRTIMLLART